MRPMAYVLPYVPDFRVWKLLEEPDAPICHSLITRLLSLTRAYPHPPPPAIVSILACEGTCWGKRVSLLPKPFPALNVAGIGPRRPPPPCPL